MDLYRCHDYKHLVARWRKLARRCGLRCTTFAEADGYELIMLTPRDISPEGGVYLSAGIHGDEPAGTEGLLQWAEAGGTHGLPCVIFPCLNPWGLVNNNRLDASGRDLNREWQEPPSEAIRILKTKLEGWQFSLALTLHEDYDGRGLYLYEVTQENPFWGDELLAAASPYIAIESRNTIDGRRISRTGLVQRRFRKGNYPMVPEALYLHEFHARRTFTFETPSEFALETRVRAQHLLIQASVERTLKEAGAALGSQRP